LKTPSTNRASGTKAKVCQRRVKSRWDPIEPNANSDGRGGIIEDGGRPCPEGKLASGFVIVTLLHVIAGWRERAGDRARAQGSDGWLAVGPPLSIPDKGARIVTPPDGERIAVFRDGTQIGALSNLCAHQNGPIGEGRIIDGCVATS
jgi:hypothetical protein